MKKIIEVENISKIYGRKVSQYRALENISFTVDKGDFLGIMGPSGAGKTTLLNLMSSIDKPTSGSIKISGIDLSKMKDRKMSEFRRKELGFIFQDFNLMDALNVQDNILLPLALDRKKSKEMFQRLEYVTKNLGIHHLLKKFPEEISVGQRQRVAAARALIVHPQLIFADEPTGSLDSKSATELLQHLVKMNQEEQVTIAMVTHDAFTASYCQRILFIKDGEIFSEIVRNGTRKEFFAKIIEMQAAIGGGVEHEII